MEEGGVETWEGEEIEEEIKDIAEKIGEEMVEEIL